jgi:hypothetical protein
MRNPFCFGITTATNYSAYLFIVTTPGKLTGWIGLPTESTASIITAHKSWLIQTELLGRTKSVHFIRTDAGSAFTSMKLYWYIHHTDYCGIGVLTYGRTGYCLPLLHLRHHHVSICPDVDVRTLTLHIRDSKTQCEPARHLSNFDDAPK